MNFKIEPVVYYDEPDRKVVDLRPEGVPFIQLASRTQCRYTRDSPGLHVHKGLGELVYCGRGALSFETPGKIWPFLPGDVFVSGPDEPHTMCLNLKGAFVYRLLIKWPKQGRSLPGLTSGESAELVKILGNGSPRLFVGGDEVRGLFDNLFSLYDDRSGDSSLRGMRMRTCALSILLVCADAARRARPRASAHGVNGWISRMVNHPGAEFQLEAMARDAGMSVPRFQAAFKYATGLPVHAYMMLCRIEGVKRAVRGNPGVSALALSHRFRFSSVPHFAATFKRIAGKTFSDYVKSLKEERR